MNLSVIKTGVASVLLSGLVMSACNVTDLTPASSLSGEQFYRTRSDANAALTSIYSRLTDQDATERLFYWGEARADQTGLSPGWGMNGDVPDTKRQVMRKERNINDWSPMYTCIQRANDALANIPNIPTGPGFSVADRDKLVGEAATLRAFCYLNLARTFGGVPLVLEPSDRADRDYLKARATETEVLDQIEKDLTFAISKMPKPTQSGNDRRRASRGAAKALLVHAKMWRNDFQGALTVANDLIDNEGYSLQPTASYMLQFWTEGGTNEIIFSLDYDRIKPNIIGIKTNSSTGFGIVAAPTWVTKMRGRGEPVRGQQRSFFDLGNNSLVLKVIGNPTADLTKPGWDLTYQTDANGVPRDQPYLRLADIILLRAEAKNRLNDRAGALIDVNTIRTRANMPVLKIEDLNTVEKMEDAILDERDIELCFEGQRWWDLVRVARRNRPDVLYTQATNLLGATEKAAAVKMLTDGKDKGSWYYPIRDTEIRNNKNLQQYDFYK